MIPAPQSMETENGSFPLPKGTGVRLDPAFCSVREGVLALLPDFCERADAPVRICLDAALLPEQYTVFCDAEGVLASSGGPCGAVYAAAAISELTVNGKMPFLRLSDHPYYAWRGLHFDPCRHFFPVTTLYKLVDLLSLYRMNRLHLHLSDDQGYRIESERFPLLNTVGSWRRSSAVKLGSGERQDGKPHGGYYTKAELRALVQYAAVRGVEIVPEIDLPGHASAMLAAYPELACFKRKTEVETRYGIRDFSSHIFCAGNEAVFSFLFALLDEVSELFPSQYFHIGGDEAGKAEWHRCPACQARMQALGLKDERALQGWFLMRLADHLKTRGKRAIIWNDGMTQSVTPDVICQHWTPGAIESDARTSAHLNAGGQAIMSGFRHVYLDYPYAMTPLKRCYTYDPIPARASEEGKANILGVECTLWTEWIRNEKKLFFNLLPRLAAVAELGWLGPKRPDYRDFLERLGAHYALYEAMGLPYAAGMEKADGFFRRLRTVRAFFNQDAEVELRGR